jgi:SAM-dependent methyltransferase
VNIAWMIFLAIAVAAGLFLAYNAFHYILYLYVTHLKDVDDLGHSLNEYERRQLAEWMPRLSDFRKHDDENRTYDDVFGRHRDENDNYSAGAFPRAAFSNPYDADLVLLNPTPGMRLLDLGCGSGAAAHFIASNSKAEILCVTNSVVQADICRRKFVAFHGRVSGMLADFDSLELPEESFDAIYSLESIGYTKDLDAWLARCLRMLKPGGRLLIRTPGALDHCKTDEDFHNVTEFFENWRYNFFGPNLLVYKLRGTGFTPILCRKVPFWAYGMTLNFLQHAYLWKNGMRMRSFVGLERIIWNTSKGFVFGNPYAIVLATKPAVPQAAQSCDGSEARAEAPAAFSAAADSALSA